MSDYNWKEMMAIFFARQIEDGDRITSGAHTEIFFAATMLAQKTHAPNMKLQLGGTCCLCNVSDQVVERLPATSTAYEILRYAESVHGHEETFLFYGAPGGKRYYEKNSPYRDTNHFWFADKFFVGGIQADRHGNTNLIGIGAGGKFKLRGPGTVGINDTVVGVRESFIFVTAHDRNRLVEQVDYVSMPGVRTCKENEFNGRPRWIVTPKAIFDFDPKDDMARLYALLPGVGIADVKSNTGFDIRAGKRVRRIAPPTRRELRTLREEVDRTGVLRA